MDVGPAAESPKAAAFREFWGPCAELRRFKVCCSARFEPHPPAVDLGCALTHVCIKHSNQPLVWNLRCTGFLPCMLLTACKSERCPLRRLAQHMVWLPKVALMFS